mgnify:CR=1 FL=1
MLALAHQERTAFSGEPTLTEAVSKLSPALLREAVISVKVFEVLGGGENTDAKRVLPRKQMALHSLAVGCCAGQIAEKVLEPEQRQTAYLAGLLHDIGKAVDHEVEGPHATIGAELAKKYGESSKVIHALAAHHEDVEPESVLAVLVQAADTLSGARPGARKELMETYVKRLEELETIANSYRGVGKSYAIQAGRELRIIVENDKISDEESVMLSRDIAKQIETDLSYPGQIKVTVIRETRAVEYAK